MFAIFGYGNVTCLGEALQPVSDQLPTWRGQNEQGMALAAMAFAKARHRRQIMVAASSIGPGSTNMITAAAHANRLPLLLFSGDYFTHRIVDPVLQQVENFGDPTISVCDTFRPVTRYWDRITSPEQIVPSFPQALGVMLDPADCGPAFLALPQDVQSEAYNYPVAFFSERVHYIRRPAPDARETAAAATMIAEARQPLIIAGGGVHYSGAVTELTDFAAQRGIPVVETVAGKSVMVHDHPKFRRGDGRYWRSFGQSFGRPSRSGDSGRDPAPGFHHRIVDSLPAPRGPVRFDQHRPMGRPQTTRPVRNRRLLTESHPNRPAIGQLPCFRGVAAERPDRNG